MSETESTSSTRLRFWTRLDLHSRTAAVLAALTLPFSHLIALFVLLAVAPSSIGAVLSSSHLPTLWKDPPRFARHPIPAEQLCCSFVVVFMRMTFRRGCPSRYSSPPQVDNSFCCRAAMAGYLTSIPRSPLPDAMTSLIQGLHGTTLRRSQTCRPSILYAPYNHIARDDSHVPTVAPAVTASIAREGLSMRRRAEGCKRVSCRRRWCRY